MEIKEKKVEVKMFEVDGITFNSKEEAEEYIEKVNQKYSWNYFYVKSHPNTIDGGFYSTRRYCIELEDSEMSMNLLIQRLLSEFGSAIDYIGHSYQTPVPNFMITPVVKDGKDWLTKFELDCGTEYKQDGEIITLSLNKRMTQLETEYEKSKRERDLAWQ